MGTQETANLAFKPVKKRARTATQVTLKLTSMIDMFTILLVFLLKSYSAEGQIMSIAPDLRLPESTAQKSPETTSIIAITNDFIMLDGKQVATVQQVMRSKTLEIVELRNALRRLRQVRERVGEIHSDMSFKGKISIQGDRELPYLVIKKIMFTCGKVGYNDMLLAVTKPD